MSGIEDSKVVQVIAALIGLAVIAYLIYRWITTGEHPYPGM